MREDRDFVYLDVLAIGLPTAQKIFPGTESNPKYKRDYEQKPLEYSDRGILEFWRIEPDRKWVQIGILTANAY